ncbi:MULTISPECIES: hypothetical protein [Paraburkholderia]|uniref:DUF4189 domain-containing protein n=1 Tax=Paraburkholderia podalyriae TaxID=1938811 RepID=A0ABR7PZ68_9BURK|nr:hypothetical protein [Paraburkholderia podalyriae]MBC8751573.1 hypothetical protein [Paraburkholderia podalyriae]
MTKSRVLCMYLLLMLWALVSGCTTLADAKLARGTGTTRLYSVTPDIVWRSLPNVVTTAGLDFIDENQSAGYALAQHGINVLSYGENVAIFVEPGRTASTTIVEVVSKRAMATNILATNWEQIILDGLSKVLANGSSTTAAHLVARDADTLTTRYPESNFAAIGDVSAVPTHDQHVRELYAAWLDKPIPRAFAVSDSGQANATWGTPTSQNEPPDAAERALKHCRDSGLQGCKLYAVDHRVVYVP